MQSDPLEALRCGRRDLRVVLVAAHPDDETIGAGSRIPLLPALTVVHVTDGSPRNMLDARRHGFPTSEEYAAARRREFACAMMAAGASPDHIELGFPDQEATLRVAEIVEALLQIIAEIQPAFLLTHPYEGGHPDHDACAIAVRLAAGGLPVVEFTSYHRKGKSISTGEFAGESADAMTVELDEQQRATRRRMLDCYGTQRETLQPFGVEHERFRLAPAYDFAQLPNGGALYYEQFPWGMTGERFLELTRKVLARCCAY